MAAPKRLAGGRNPAVALRKKRVYALWSTPERLMAQTPGRLAYLTGRIPHDHERRDQQSQPGKTTAGSARSVWIESYFFADRRFNSPSITGLTASSASSPL